MPEPRSRARVAIALVVLPGIVYAALLHIAAWITVATNGGSSGSRIASVAFALVFLVTPTFVVLRRSESARAALFLVPLGPGLGVAVGMLTLGPLWHLSFERVLDVVTPSAVPLLFVAPVATMVAGGVHVLAAARRDRAGSVATDIN